MDEIDINKQNKGKGNTLINTDIPKSMKTMQNRNSS